MEKETKVKQWLFLIASIFLILTAQEVHALGISPASIEINTTDEARNITLSIINNEHKELNLTARIEGPLKNYILIPQIISLNNNTEIKEIEILLNIPKNISSGSYKNKVIIEENTVSAKTISTKLQVVSGLVINISKDKNQKHTYQYYFFASLIIIVVIIIFLLRKIYKRS